MEKFLGFAVSRSNGLTDVTVGTWIVHVDECRLESQWVRHMVRGYASAVDQSDNAH